MAGTSSEKVQLFPNNCPIRCRTGDGTPVGRCWHWTGEGPQHLCPMHGDVAEVVAEYQKTGKLTDENDFKRKE